MIPKLLDGHPHVQKFLKEFRKLNGIHEAEKAAAEYTLNDPVASFNGTIPAPN